MTLADLDINKTYTYADYLKWDFKERVEILKGRLYKMTPAPSRQHQWLSMNIAGSLWRYLSGKPCQVYSAPFDVRLPRKTKNDKDIITVFQPDICVICDESKLDDRGCVGAPDIIIEILSPGNNTKELKNKFEIYQEAGVQEYWIVSPQNHTFVINVLKNGKYETARMKGEDDIITTPILPGFELNLAELFSGY